MMMGLIPWRSFQAQQQTFILKTATHGDVQFMSWMKYFKAIYLDHPSGNPAHVQGSILVTHHFMQDN